MSSSATSASFQKNKPRFLGVILILIVSFFWFLHPIGGEADIFHHLNTGRWILEHHQIPSTDEWTFTANGQPWIANAWGFDIPLYLIFSTFGYNGLSVFFALIGVFTLFLLFIWLRLNRIKYSNILFSLGVAMATISIRWLNKPEVVTYSFILAILIINKLHQHQPRKIYLLPLIMFLWSIIYGAGTPIGVFILILFLIRQFYLDNFRFKSINFYLIYIFSILVTFLNGLGINGTFYFLLTGYFKNYLPEWGSVFNYIWKLPFEFRLTYQYQILIYLLYLITFIILFFTKFKEAKKEKFLLFLSLGIFSPFLVFRNIILAIILSISLFAKLLPQKNIFLYPVLIVLLILSFLNNDHGLGFNSQGLSPQLVAFFQKNNLKGYLLTKQNLSPYLSFELFPNILVYFDTRDDLYFGGKVLNFLNPQGNQNPVNEYLESLASFEKTKKLIDKYNISIIVADYSLNVYEPLIISPDWSLVGIFDQNIIFIKKDLAVLNNLKTYNNINPFIESFVKDNNFSEAISEYRDLLTNQKKSSFLNYALAKALSSSGDLKQSNQIIKSLPIPSDRSSSFLYSYLKYDFLTLNYLSSRSCSDSKIYLNQLHKLITHKLILDPSSKISNSDDYYYLIYYSLCENNFWKSQNYLQKILKNKTNNSDFKNQAIKTMESLSATRSKLP